MTKYPREIKDLTEFKRKKGNLTWLQKGILKEFLENNKSIEDIAKERKQHRTNISRHISNICAHFGYRNENMSSEDGRLKKTHYSYIGELVQLFCKYKSSLVHPEVKKRYNVNIPFYLERLYQGGTSIERKCKANISGGNLTKIKGNSLTGKTFLIKYLNDYITQEKQDHIVVNIDFRDFEAKLNNYKISLDQLNHQNEHKRKIALLSEFRQWFYLVFAVAVEYAFKELKIELNSELENCFRKELKAEEKSVSQLAKEYFEQQFFENIDKQTIVIFLDNFDLILQLEPYLSFGQSIRKWFDYGGEKTWGKISWFLAYSTEIYFDLGRHYVSPIQNKGCDIELCDFDKKQIKVITQNQINETEEFKDFLDLTEKEIDTLYDLTGGNPYLVDQSLNYLIDKNKKLINILSQQDIQEHSNEIKEDLKYLFYLTEEEFVLNRENIKDFVNQNKRLINILNREVIGYKGEFKKYNRLFSSHLNEKLELLEKSSPKTTDAMNKYKWLKEIPKNIQEELEQELYFNFLKIIEEGKIGLGKIIAFQLEIIGLVKKVGDSYKTKYKLYEHFFSLLISQPS